MRLSVVTCDGPTAILGCRNLCLKHWEHIAAFFLAHSLVGCVLVIRDYCLAA